MERRVIQHPTWLRSASTCGLYAVTGLSELPGNIRTLHSATDAFRSASFPIVNPVENTAALCTVVETAPERLQTQARMLFKVAGSQCFQRRLRVDDRLLLLAAYLGPLQLRPDGGSSEAPPTSRVGNHE